MKKILLHEVALTLESQLKMLIGHDHIRVRIHGEHLPIDCFSDNQWNTIARLTLLSSNSYGAAFRNNHGRWEPLPISGNLNDMAINIVDLLSPYFQVFN